MRAEEGRIGSYISNIFFWPFVFSTEIHFRKIFLDSATVSPFAFWKKKSAILGRRGLRRAREEKKRGNRNRVSQNKPSTFQLQQNSHVPMGVTQNRNKQKKPQQKLEPLCVERVPTLCVSLHSCFSLRKQLPFLHLYYVSPTGGGNLGFFFGNQA